MIVSPIPDRVVARLPRRELVRRWGLVRERLAERSLEALIVFNSEDYLGGNVRWLTDRPAYHSYGTAVLFHRDDLMTVVEHGFMGVRRVLDGDDLDYPGVGEIIQTSAFHSVNYTQAYEARIVVDVLRARGYRRVAIAGAGGMPHGFASMVLATDDIAFVDETDFIDGIRAIKSKDEQGEIARTAAMQDRVFATVLGIIKPGIRDLDISAAIQAEGRREGSEQEVVLIGSAPAGQAAMMRFPRFQNRILEKGDAITILIENNGPAGYYTELGRVVTLGRAPQQSHDAIAAMVAAQRSTIERFVPGTPCAEIAHAHDAYMQARGHPPETRLYAHGQGYSLVERPLIRADETMHVQAGMNLVAHPAFADAGDWGYVCDNYLVRADGEPKRLHGTEQILFELPC